MKHFFFLAAFALCASVVAAQGNLQFNRAIVMSNGETFAVPAGKVWKITAMTVGDGINGDDAHRFFITLNGVQNHLIYSNRSGSWGDRSATAPSLPFWVPEGTTLGVPAFGGSTSTTRIRTLSILEFNLVN